MANQQDENGNRHGPWECYYNNGQLEFKGEYKHDKLHGLWEHYGSNGQIRWKGECKNGKDRGLWYEIDK